MAKIVFFFFFISPLKCVRRVLDGKYDKKSCVLQSSVSLMFGRDTAQKTKCLVGKLSSFSKPEVPS